MQRIEGTATTLFQRTLDCHAPVLLHKGGARSSKSYSIAQALIWKALNWRGKEIGICRKTFPSMRKTCMKLFLALLQEYGIYNKRNHNKTANTYVLNGNTITFFSLSDPEKIKSTEFNILWLEEANEFTYDDFMTLQTRLSGKCAPGEWNQMILSFNPIDGTGWIPQDLIKKARPGELEIIHSTYKDNPFVPDFYVAYIEGLKDKDPHYYNVYCLGEWGILKGLIYTWQTVARPPEGYGERVFYGLDFGGGVPSALVEVHELEDNRLYVREALYEERLTTPDIIKHLERIISPGDRHREIYADSAEPDRIEEICRAGFNCKPAQKPILAGIDTVKRFKLLIDEEAVNVLAEIGGYRWKETRDNKQLNMPVEFNDHAMDALRYAVHTHFRGQTFTQYIYAYSTARHELSALPEYHAQRRQRNEYSLSCVIRPEDTKPWAIGWYLTYPNGDTLTVAEYPDSGMKPYARLFGDTNTVADYARLIRATEEAIGKAADVRIIDPDHAAGGLRASANVAALLAKEGLPCRPGNKDVQAGHIAVNALLGDVAAGVRPKFYVLAHCLNHSHSMRHYALKERAGVPEQVDHEFAALVRWGALDGFKYRAPAKPMPALYRPRTYGNPRYRGGR